MRINYLVVIDVLNPKRMKIERLRNDFLNFTHKEGQLI